ncbi:MATH domain and coiled-coil domain-containing protein [Cardamine amara subsp. amara]|uniref:MATH domain and coiled-coil domain-containing protein n=1 Tax=Cardamine amara subsp. amara TaxID=228776 RepID=A0ABD0YZV5_CARAN
MENYQQTSFTLEIDKFSEKEAAIFSPIFVSGGCEWLIQVYPKECLIKNHLSVFFHVAKPESLQPGWKRRAIISYIILNHSGEELKRTPEACYLFCHEFPS